uniref:Reverse transcriptase domain-containing protein n=1 Tax=Tanacetum cinerariifolium TaxID=118510 RepID=A0A699IPB2_TANCI|nr:reverse transcriptase domain-containing protein [Tanacetum cinerariifolium]
MFAFDVGLRHACMHASLYMVQELGDQVRLERWQGMVRARAARSDKDGLLSAQAEDSAFFLVPKVMTDIVRKEFKARDKALLYNSKYKFKAPKLRPKWCGPFIVKHGYPSGYVELYDKDRGSFIVNGHRVKLYHDEEQLNKLTIEEIHLMCEEGRMKDISFMAPFLADYRKTMPWASEKPYIYSVV